MWTRPCKNLRHYKNCTPVFDFAVDARVAVEKILLVTAEHLVGHQLSHLVVAWHRQHAEVRALTIGDDRDDDLAVFTRIVVHHSDLLLGSDVNSHTNGGGALECNKFVHLLLTCKS